MRMRLRREVNFGCPVCRSPFLTYHHFDPPWEPNHIHNEPGMVALCGLHHDFADGGAYTTQDLHTLKANPPGTPPIGRLPWGPSKMLVMFGGNYFVTSKTKAFSFRVDGKEIFSLRNTEEGYLSINAAICDPSGRTVCEIVANDILPALAYLGDLTCSTQGKEIRISSEACDALLLLRYDRKEVETLTSKIRSKWPKIFSPALKIDKTEKVQKFIGTALDTDGLCPTLEIVANIRAATVPIRTLSKGIVADFRKIGYDKATFTGLDAGEGGVRFVFQSEPPGEMLYIGSE